MTHHNSSSDIDRYNQVASEHSARELPFLTALGPADRARIFNLAARAAEQLARWAARYPVIRSVRIQPLALSVAAAAPFSSIEAIVATARLSLWVFTVDDLFDEGGVSGAELRRRARQYRAVAEGRPTAGPDNDALAAALVDVREDLRRYPLFQALGGEWSQALGATLDGMIREYQWQLRHQVEPGTDLPTFDEYLATGRYSIGGPPHIWAALITTNDPSTPWHREHLRAMEEVASTCIRLANDLRSQAKEVAEGKINALVILSDQLRRDGLSPEAAYDQAVAQVRAAIGQGLDRLASLQATGPTQTGQPEAAIADIARFVCAFYDRHDYHTFPRSGRGEDRSIEIASV